MASPPGKKKQSPAASAPTNGGGKIASLDAIKNVSIPEQYVAVSEWGEDAGCLLRGLTVAQVEAINSEIGEDFDFRATAAMVAASMVEPEGVTTETLIDQPPSILAKLGPVVLRLSGMDEEAIKEAESSFREG